MQLKAENVFKPGSYPEYTYVSRNYEDTDISYELRLKQALRTAGCLTSLIGPSKMGKTILCEKVIGFNNIIEISGADFNEKFILSKDKVIQYYKENEKVLVIDDFHYASHEMQIKMAQQLKTEEVEADIVHYNADFIYFYIYDKEKIIKDKQNFEASFNKKFDGKKVTIIILQPVKI